MPTNKYLITAADNTYVNAASDIWHPGSGQGSGDGNGLVAIEDIAVLNAQSGKLTLAGAFTSVGLDMTNYASDKELELNTYDMTINGQVVALGGQAPFSGQATVIINGTGAHTLGDDATIDDDVMLKFMASSGTPTLAPVNVAFPLIGGLTIDNNPTTFVVGASTSGLRIAGDLLYTTGKFDTQTNNVAVTLSGTKNANWDTGSANRLYHLILAASAVITRGDEVRCQRLTVPATARIIGNKLVQVYTVGNDAVTVEGTVETGTLNILPAAGSVSNDNIIQGVDNLLLSADSTGRSFTQTKRLRVVSSLIIKGETGGNNAKLILSGSGHSLGAVTLGHSSASYEGFIDLGNGSGVIASLVAGNTGGGDVNIFDFSQGRWQATGILNFTDIAVEVDGVAHMQGGDVRNLNSQRVTGGVIHFHDTTDGGGNDAAIAAGEVTFDKHTPPGTLATMGVGL